MRIFFQRACYYNAHILFYRVYRFINWQAAAIRKTDPQALVTAGSWNPKSNTNMNGMKNLYSDHCLIRAGHDNAVMWQFQFHFKIENILGPFWHYLQGTA